MTVKYYPKDDLLYIRIDPEKQELSNEKVGDIVLDIGKDNRIVGIEILDASKKVDLKSFLPANYEMEEVA